MKYGLVASVILTLSIAGIWLMSNNASAQSVSASFNPQTQFPVGSSLAIASIYGVASVPLHPFNTTGMPSLFNRNGNQTSRNHFWNQTAGKHRGIPPPPWNQTFANNHGWNGTMQPYSAEYSTSVTIQGQVANDTANGGIQWTVQGGSIVLNGQSFTITGGKGAISNIDRVTVLGTAADSNGHTFRWQFQGLAATYNGTVIVELNGGGFGLNTTFPRATLTYIATIS
jgi:hypothetical protein